MRLSTRSNVFGPTFAPREAQQISWARARKVMWPVSFLLLTGILVAISIVFMPRGGAFDDGVNYGLYAVTQLACAIAVLAYLRRESTSLRLRWIMFGGGILLFAMNMTIASLIGFGVLQNGQVQFVEVLLSAIGYSLLLLSAIFMFSRATRTMALLDTLQALLFAALRYGVIFSPRTQDLFTDIHVQVSVWTPIFLFLLARTASIGAATQAEFRLLRLLSIFLGLRAISAILQGQISYLWLHHRSTSLWDIAPILSDALFCWLALKRLRRQLPAERATKPPVFVRNLMPSIIAFGNLLLALLLLRYYPAQAVEAVLLTAVCYVLRTLMLQAQVNSDQEKLHELNQQLEQLVTRDTLTGAGNRRSLIAALAGLTRTRPRQSFALVLMDADWFKQANDQHGHLYGDQVLIALANVLRTAADSVPEGHCARLGGDEFALLLPGLDADMPRAAAEKVRQRVKDLALKAGDRTVTISIGVAVSDFSAALAFETLMSRADESLYHAKSLGRDRVALWPEPRLTPLSLMPDRAEAV
jgi:diguanylate cyclase (GGDEF)-like protein